MELCNQAATAGRLYDNEFKLLNDILQTFVVSWQAQEENRRKKETEEESMYLFKGKEYGEIIDDEKEIKKSLKVIFPTYNEVPHLFNRKCKQ